jgi:glycosyltransferase involved in cell wall biosynthesis
MKKISFLLTHPIQYFSPLFIEIEKSNFSQFNVIYCEDTTGGYYDNEFSKNINWDFDLLNGYQYIFLKKDLISNYFKRCNFSIINYLFKNKPDILIIHGWGYPTSLIAIITAKILGIKIWLRAETPYIHEIKNRKVKKIFKYFFFKYIFLRLFEKFLFIGIQNKLFYNYYGIKDESRFIYTPYCVNNKKLQILESELAPHKIIFKQELKINPNNFIILFSGKLIQKKRPLDLLIAFNNANIKNSTLIFLGDGNLKFILQEYINDNNINNVIFLGFKNQSEIAKYYTIADLFVLPSGVGETWGLVVNEAMNFSLPVIVSNLVGCNTDLVYNNENGFIYEYGNTEQLSLYINEIYNNKCLQKNAKIFSKNIINKYDYETIIKNIKLEL